MTYSIFWAKGDYRDRQLTANREGCVAYLEQHFNALANDDPSTQADNGALCIVGGNASETSKNWAAWYTREVAAEFGIRDNGVLVGPRRGDFNLRYTAMPAILVEPLFVSDPTQAEIARSEDGQERLARIIVASIRRFFPDGGKVAFSVGHKYKTSNPHDRGAPVVGGGTEAELAEEVLHRAARMLRDGAQIGDPERVLRVVRGGKVVAQVQLNADDIVGWNPCTETLRIG